MNNRWPQIRAVLVGCHVVAVLAMATPSPSAGLRRSSWKDPTVQAEFSAWNERFQAMGISWTEPEMEDHLWTFAVGWDHARDLVLTPITPYGRYLGASQSWRMFVAPHRYPTRLQIELDSGDGWETLYIERSAEYAWRREVFDHDRMRSAIFRFGWTQYKKSWQLFADWVAKKAAVDFPDASRVRVRMYKYQTLSPEDAAAGKEPDGKFQQDEIRSLAKLREVAP